MWIMEFCYGVGCENVVGPRPIQYCIGINLLQVDCTKNRRIYFTHTGVTSHVGEVFVCMHVGISKTVKGNGLKLYTLI
jgi:hypothetical protein